MERTLPDTQSRQRAVAAAANGDNESETSVEHGIAAVADVNSGNTSSAENLPVSGDMKVRFMLLCRCCRSHGLHYRSSLFMLKQIAESSIRLSLAVMLMINA